MRSTKILQQLAKARLPIQSLSMRPLTLAPRRYATTLNGLPFKITRQQANETLVSHHRFLEQSTKNTTATDLVLYKDDPLKQCFIPFHSASVSDLGSSYVGEYGKDRTEYYWTSEYDGNDTRQVMQSYTVTDWYRCSGTLSSTD